MPSASVRLFVYGSLKRGERHHDVLRAAAATFLSTAQTRPGYRLEALDDYLALVRAAPGSREVVTGELYDVPASQLPALDAFEGDAYIRGRVEILASGQPSGVTGGVTGLVEESLAYFKKAR